MAWSSAAISAADLAYLAADKPILASQAIPVAPTSCIWTETGAVGATDRTLSTNPARRAYDGLVGVWTCPDATVSATWYYTMDLAAAGVEFDLIAILGHNFGTITVSALTLEVSDASNFAGASSIPIASTITTNTRIMQLSCFHTGAAALRYSAVRYARLKFAGCDAKPQFGELVLGRRLQMHAKPDVSYDSYSLHGNKEISATQGGVIHSSVFSKGQRHLSAAWRDDSTTRQALVAAWIAATSYKTRPFVWIENPNSAPSSWHYMVPDDADFDYPLEENPSIRTFTIDATEQGPESHYLATGTY
jgi:hypothetical protein